MQAGVDEPKCLRAKLAIRVGAAWVFVPAVASQAGAIIPGQERVEFLHERLEKLKAKGISFGGQSNMDIEQLRNLEKTMDGMGGGSFNTPGEFRTPGGFGGGDGTEKEEL